MMAGEPYLHLNTETGSAEGCFFAFIADFDDPQERFAQRPSTLSAT
jgi:hypothetical protein